MPRGPSRGSLSRAGNAASPDNRGVRARVAIAYVLMVLLWGSTWAAIKIGVAEVPAHVFALERAVAVATILTVAALVLRQPFPRSRTALIPTALSGLCNTGTAWVLIFWAHQFVPSPLVPVFAAIPPVWPPIL